MRSSQHQPHHSVRSPELSGTIRRPSSNDRVVARSFAGTLGASEFPIVDAQARYSISYVPGMSEHMVNTGKTLPEAQLKVVLFACEVERLNTLNYNLVKENEILKAQNTKSNREEDLETKLAIVLAENEKLNQIVEELQAVYLRERESLANEDYERRIAELLHEAEDWKNRYKKLEVSGPPSGGDKHALEDLQRERDHLREQLGRQGRDLDALRARLESFQVGGPADVRLLQEQITNLKVENEKQKSELHAMKLKYGNADGLQQSLHQYESRVRVLLDENDKLNHLLTEKTREMQASQNAREISIAQRPQEHVVRAVAGSPTQGHHEIVDKLTHENHDLKEKATRLAAENERLNGLVLELRNEAEHLRRQVSEGQGVGNRRADQLTVQINTLLEENKRLNSLLEAKAREEDFRTKSAQLISENDRLNKLVIDLRAETDHLNKRLAESGKNAHLSASITSLQTENSHLNGLLKQRIDEIEGLKHRNRELELGAGSVADLKNKVGALVTENDRLNRLATDLSADNERLKRSSANTTRINELTVQVNNLLAENTRLNDLLVTRVREIETLRQENDRLKHQIHDLEGSGARITQLTLQINNLLEENKKLNHLLLERGDTEVLRRRVTELEASIATLRTENERLVRQVSEHGHGKERIELLTQQINSLLAENQRLNTLLIEKSGHSGKVTELTNQVNGLTAENRRLNEIITQRTTEIDSLRRRITELDSSSSVITELRGKLSLTASENERLNHLVADHRAELDKLRLQVAESSRSSHLSGQLNSLLSENTRLNELLIQKSNEVETLRRKGIEADELRTRVSTITSENERLKITINEQRAELDRLRAQSHDTGRVHELSAHVSGLHDENRKLSSLAQDRANEVDALKKKVQDAQAGSGHQLAHLTEENRRLNALLLEKSSELDRLKYQSVDTSKIQELNIQITRLQDENRRQNTLILERTTELDTLRRRLVEAEAHGGKARIDQLTVQINTLLTENSRLNDSLTNRIREVEELKARSSTTNIVSVSSGDINNLRATLVILAAENERLNAAVEQNKTRVSSTSADDSSSLRISVQHLTSELDESRRKLIEAQVAARESEDLKKKIQILTLDSQSFQGILKDKTTEIDTLRTKVYTLEAAARETETLKLRIAQLESGHHGDAEGARSAFVLLSAENDRLKAELAKAGEHHHHHHHEPVQTNLHISGDIGTVEVLAADNDRIGRELEIVRRTLHDKDTEIESLKKRLTVDQSAELRNRVESLLNENEKLNNYLVERQREIESLRHKLGEQPAEGHLHVDVHDVHHHDEGAKKSALPHVDVVIHHHDVEAIEDVIRLRTIITEQTKQLETLSKRIQEADFLKQENERITRLLSEKLKEVDELKRSPTPSTAVTTVAGTERSEEVELLKKRIAELEAHDAKHHHHTGIFAAVKEKILEKLGAGHEHEQGDLEGEYARLLDAQITEVNERFEQERQQFKRTEENLNIKIQQLEESVTLITSEKDKLSAAQEKSKQEIDNWKRRYEHFESQKEMEMDALKLDLEKKYRESPSRKGIPEQVIDLEDRVTYLNNEIERLQDHLNMTLTELEEWRKRYSELEVLRAQEIDELRQQFDNSKKSSIEAKEIQIKFNAERTAYEAQILQLQQKVGDVQNEIKTLTAENERLEKLSITRLEEAEEVRRSHGGSTSITSTQTLEITQLKTQIESYKAASHNVKQLAIKYSAEKAADLSQIRQLKQINENYKSELEKLYELLDERKADFESLTKQNEDLLKMYEKIVSTTSTEKVDIRASQDRTSFTPKELTEMESTKEQYMKNSIELTRKNKELVDKLQELDILKMKYEEALANYQALNARLFEKLNAER